MLRARAIRSRHELAILYLKRSDNVFRWHVSVWCGCPLIDDVNPTVAKSSRLSLKGWFSRGVASNDAMHELNEDTVSTEEVGGDPFMRFEEAGKHTDDGLGGQPLFEREVRRQEGDAITEPLWRLDAIHINLGIVLWHRCAA